MQTRLNSSLTGSLHSNHRRNEEASTHDQCHQHQGNQDRHKPQIPIIQPQKNHGKFKSNKEEGEGLQNEGQMPPHSCTLQPAGPTRIRVLRACNPQSRNDDCQDARALDPFGYEVDEEGCDDDQRVRSNKIPTSTKHPGHHDPRECTNRNTHTYGDDEKSSSVNHRDTSRNGGDHSHA